jgi:hypothetical protein
MESQTNLYVLHKRRESSNGHEREKINDIHYYFTPSLQNWDKTINVINIHVTVLCCPPWILLINLPGWSYNYCQLGRRSCQDKCQCRYRWPSASSSILYVPVHIQEWFSCEHIELCWEACLFSPPKWSSVPHYGTHIRANTIVSSMFYLCVIYFDYLI